MDFSKRQHDSLGVSLECQTQSGHTNDTFSTIKAQDALSCKRCTDDKTSSTDCITRLKFVAISLLLFGCTTVNKTAIVVNKEPYHYIDSAFRPTLAIFEYVANQHSVPIDESNISMTFGLIKSKDSSTVGTCETDALGVMVIKIDEPGWKDMDAYEQEALIMHELGHCLLGRRHCKKKKNKRPVSIMYPNVLKSKHYKKHRKEYVHELFYPYKGCE